MAKLFILAALVAVACATPTPLTKVPKTILGLFQNIPEEQENFKEFTKLLGAPDSLDVNKPSHVGVFEKDGQYFARFYFYPNVPSTLSHSFTLELPFKLGETQTKVIKGKNVEYIYTVDGDEHSPTLHAKFRDVDSGNKFTVEAKFDDQGIRATYTKDNLVAKRHYRRVLPPYVVGAFVNIPEKSSPNVKEFYTANFPLPKPLTWTEKVAVWLAPEGDHYVDKTIAHPSYFFKVDFKLGEKKTIQYKNESFEYEYRLMESSPDKTVLRIQLKCSKGVLVNEMTFDHEGFTYTTKKDSGEQVNGAFKRVVPFKFFGKFEDVPEKAENWEEFTKGFDMLNNIFTTTEIYHKGDEYHLLKKGGDKSVDITFKLNTPQEKTSTNGKTVKYTVTVDGVAGKIFLRTEGEIVGTNEKFTVATFAKDCGLVSKYYRGNVVATRYYRRVVSPAILGSFESSGEDTEEFKAFVNAIGSPHFLKKITNEFVQATGGNLTHKMSEEGDPTVHETTFRLGTPTELEAHGHHINHTTFYVELQGKPIITSVVRDTAKPEHAFRVTAIFTPEGYEAFYAYGGDVTHGAEKIATRKFVRKGAPVPIEQH